MSLIETDIFGVTHDKVAMSIDCLRTFEPPEGYRGATSFGKDSVCIYRLSEEAGLKKPVEWHYSVTTLDPPELIRFGHRNFPGVIWDKPDIPLLKLVETKGFPVRNRAWCCELYKESYGSDRTIVLGVRWAESNKRSKRRMVETCYRDTTKRYINPIIGWSDLDVWEFIHSRNLPYCELYDSPANFDRIGCIMCPKPALWKRKREAARYPGMEKAWKKAFMRLYENNGQRESYKMWKSWQEMFDWWMSEQQGSGDPDQGVMFE